jgi:hypothetical protein
VFVAKNSFLSNLTPCAGINVFDVHLLKHAFQTENVRPYIELMILIWSGNEQVAKVIKQSK